MRLLARSILFRNRKRGNAQILELAQDDLQLRQLLLVRLADHDRGIDRRKCGAHVMRELEELGIPRFLVPQQNRQAPTSAIRETLATLQPASAYRLVLRQILTATAN